MSDIFIVYQINFIYITCCNESILFLSIETNIHCVLNVMINKKIPFDGDKVFSEL